MSQQYYKKASPGERREVMFINLANYMLSFGNVVVVFEGGRLETVCL